MLVAIAADLHDNLANWKKFNQYAKKQGIKNLIFCGDLCNKETLKEIDKSFRGDIYIIAGNQELYDILEIKKYPQFHFIGRYGRVIIDKLHLGLAHEPEYISVLKKTYHNLDYIFHGHTHKPWLEKENNLIIANPGTLGGIFYEASFALLDTKNNYLELKILNNAI